MSVTYANVRTRSYVVMSNRVGGYDALARPVVEYANTSSGHYFMTISSSEMTMLDRGDFANWTRTGGAFLAREGTFAGDGGLGPVCRFYGRPEAWPDSHFLLCKRGRVRGSSPRVLPGMDTGKSKRL